jgi:hypothetical protein
MTRFLKVTLCAVVAGLALAATPALAGSYTLDLSGPSTATVGQPVVFVASGVNPPPDQFWEMSWIEVVAIHGSVLPACPADDQSALSVASTTGGKILAIADRPNLDSAGNFYNTVGWTPVVPGRWLICGYQDDGEGLTLAHAALAVDVSAATAPPASVGGGGGSTPMPTAAKPVNTKRPHVTRSRRKLVCDPGTWSGASGSYSYSWLVNGKPKKHATAAKLRVTSGLRRHRLQCRVTATGAGGSATAVSPALRVR